MINVKEKVNQLFRDKMVLVMLVLGLLTLVAAAGAVKIRKGNENLESCSAEYLCSVPLQWRSVTP